MLPENLVIAGENFGVRLGNSATGKFQTDRERLAEVIAAAEAKNLGDEHTLPEYLWVDGERVSVHSTRTNLAVGLAVSRSEVDDLEVLRLIAGSPSSFGFAEMMHAIPRWSTIVAQVSKLARSKSFAEKAAALSSLYVGKRGLMVVDVVASRQRRYEAYVVPVLLAEYQKQAQDLSLKTLVSNPPTFLKLRDGEAQTIKEVAELILGLLPDGEKDEELAIKRLLELGFDDAWTEYPLAINGIGPALFNYLLILSGADTVKVDVRVRRALDLLGIDAEIFTDTGLLMVCRILANDVGCSLAVLDQVLWHFGE